MSCEWSLTANEQIETAISAAVIRVSCHDFRERQVKCGVCILLATAAKCEQITLRGDDTYMVLKSHQHLLLYQLLIEFTNLPTNC